MNFIDIVFASFLANNLLFFRFLGLTEFLSEGGESRLGLRTALLTVLLLVGSMGYWAIDHYWLQPAHLETLRTLAVFTVVALVAGFYASLARGRPQWPQPQEFLVHSLLVGGILVLGSSSSDAAQVATAAVASALGYGGALVVLGAGFRRLTQERIPAFVQGLPLRLMTFGLVWLVLQGLSFAFAGVSS